MLAETPTKLGAWSDGEVFVDGKYGDLGCPSEVTGVLLSDISCVLNVRSALDMA